MSIVKFYTIADLSEEACETQIKCSVQFAISKNLFRMCRKLEKYKCLLCRKILAIAPENICSREFYNYGGSSNDE